MADRDNSAMVGALMLVAGGIIGAGVALLFAPQSGQKTRKDITRYAKKVRRKAEGVVDDFAARVYVVFPSALFWRTRAINYVWASKLPKNMAAPSPFTGNAVILAVESGEERAGRWVSEERNFYEDYKRLFGEEPTRIGAVAIMTDTDDTKDEVTAWYGDISLEDR